MLRAAFFLGGGTPPHKPGAKQTGSIGFSDCIPPKRNLYEPRTILLTLDSVGSNEQQASNFCAKMGGGCWVVPPRPLQMKQQTSTSIACCSHIEVVHLGLQK